MLSCIIEPVAVLSTASRRGFQNKAAYNWWEETEIDNLGYRLAVPQNYCDLVKEIVLFSIAMYLSKFVLYCSWTGKIWYLDELLLQRCTWNNSWYASTYILYLFLVFLVPFLYLYELQNLLGIYNSTLPRKTILV